MTESPRHYPLDDSPQFRWVELDEVDSTNDFLRHYRPPRPVPVTLATAEFQTAGRGAGQNHWESERGKNLLFSIRLELEGMQQAALLGEAQPPLNVRVFALSEMLALAICDALSDYAPGFCVKWPNDIYHGDRKIAGTLIENELSGRSITTSIMGTGINVNQTCFLSDAPNPVSLAQVVGHTVERRQVLEGVLFHLARYRSLFLRGELQQLHTSYTARLYRWQEEHTFADSNGTFRARITDVQPDGHLLLLDTHNHPRRYAFKEVTYELSPTPMR